MQRMTRQRQAIGTLLDGTKDFRSAQQVHELLRTQGDSIGLATVYRTLQALADQGDVDVVRKPDGESVYRSCRRSEHHHHLICRGCGATEEIDGPSVEQWAQAVGEEHGFTDISHTIELYGLCADCRAARPDPR